MLTRRRLRTITIALASSCVVALPAFATGTLQKTATSPEAFAAMLRWLENEQRQIEWWFKLLGTGVASAIVVLVASAVVVPMLLTRRQRYQMDHHVREAYRLVEEMRESVEQRAPGQRQPEYRSALERAPANLATLDDTRRYSIEKAVAEALADPETPVQTRLRAEALHSEVQRHWGEAQSLWHALRKLNERDGQALFGEAHARKQLAQRYTKPNMQRELQAITVLCQKVIQLNARHFEAHGLRARALSEMAHMTIDHGSAGALFLRADSGFREALHLAPDNVELRRSRADNLRDHARRTLNGEANRGYARAAEAYGETLELAADDLLALDGLLQTQIERAWINFTAGKPTENLFEVLDDRLRKASSHGANESEVLRRQAMSTAMRLRFVPSERSRSYFQLVRDRVNTVWAEHPEDRDTQLAWALAQFHLACHANKGGALRERLLTQAQKTFLRCEQMTPGIAAFHLARLDAQRGAPGRARQWVDRAQRLNLLPPCSILRAAPDLELVKESAWYLKLLQDCGCLGPR